MLIDFEEEDDTIAGVEEEERRDDIAQMSELEEVKTSAPQVFIKDRPAMMVKRAQASEEEVKGAVKERASITKQLRLKKHGGGAKKEEDAVPH
jgi:hypothetical protein